MTFERAVLGQGSFSSLEKVGQLWFNGPLAALAFCKLGSKKSNESCALNSVFKPDLCGLRLRLFTKKETILIIENESFIVCVLLIYGDTNHTHI